MTTCWITKSLLPLFSGGDLPAPLASRVSRHLSRCEACAAEYHALKASQDAVRQAAQEIWPPLSTDFAERVRLEVDAQPAAGTTAPLYRRPSVLAWTAAAILIVAGLGLLREHRAGAPVSRVDQAVVSPEETATSPLADEPGPEELSRTELTALMTRLNPNPDLTDEELDAKYPVVESITRPGGTPVIYRTQDPHITIVWILPQKGVQAQ